MIHEAVCLIFLLFSFYQGSATQDGAGIFKLPELIVQTNNSYLTRSAETRLECRIAGQPVEWAGATLQHVLWLRDGTSIDTTAVGGHANFISTPSNANVYDRHFSLRIVRTGHHSEGEYQCTAIIRHVSLSSARSVDTRLVSAPLKLRRARITKFEHYEAPVVHVRQGQVARLPCYGLPDVIPGPPDLWFEKMGHENFALGRTGKERFIVTASGLQIALSQPSDAGRYFCIVRNTFTNQTRKAPQPVHLVVDADEISSSEFSAIAPQITYPDSSNRSEPIDFHVVAGQSAILECVIWGAKIVWNRTNHTLTAVSLTDERARIQQIWGNLQIKQVRLEDTGEYICQGRPLFDSNNNGAQKLPPQAIYRLIVHAPTNVRLMLAQSLNDKSWQLSCYAHNLHYEIPMVYVNGLALIDAMEEMGVPLHTNFFTNPINITFSAENPLAGSVQCISRPAMEEAEIYGAGLERGRSMNLFVDARTVPRATVSTDRQPRVNPHSAPSADNDLPTIQRPVAFVAGDNSVRVQWRVEPSDNSRRQRIQYFSIEILRRGAADTPSLSTTVDYADGDYPDDEEAPSSRAATVSDGNSDWQLLERVPPHVRALTLRRVVATANNEFQLRVTAALDNSGRVSSPPTDWLRIAKSHANTFAVPSQPTITRVQAMSPHSIFVAWNHSDNAAPHKFLVSFEPFETNYHKQRVRPAAVEDERLAESWMQRSVEVGGQRPRNELLLTDLSADTAYKIIVLAVNTAGRSLPSLPKIAKTYVYLSDSPSNSWMTKLRRDYLNMPELNVKVELLFAAVCITVILLILVCCLTAARLHDWHIGHPITHRQIRAQQGSSIGSANQFFLDSSSPTGFSAPSPTNGLLARKCKSDRQPFEHKILRLPKSGEMSPLGGYDNVYRNNEKDFTLQLSLQNDNYVKSSLLRKANEDNNNNDSGKMEYVSRQMISELRKDNANDNSPQMPNIYGNPKATLDELMENVYGGMTQPTVNDNYGSVTLSRNATISRAGTLRRMASSQRWQGAPLMDGTRLMSPTTTTNTEAHYSSTLALNRLSSELRFSSVLTPNGRKSPSPSMLSSSMYGGPFIYPPKSIIQSADINKNTPSLPPKCTSLGLKMMQSDAADSLFVNGMSRMPNLDSVYNSRLSLSNCGNSSIANNELKCHSGDYGIFIGKEAAATVAADAQPSILSMLPSSANNGNSLSTFKASPAPSSCGGSSSSGYNSNHGGNAALTIYQANLMESANALRSTQNPLMPAYGVVEPLNFVGQTGQHTNTLSPSYSSTIERRKRNPTIAVAPMFFGRNPPGNNTNNEDLGKPEILTDILSNGKPIPDNAN